MNLYNEVLTYMFSCLLTDEQREAMERVIETGIEAQCFCILKEIQAIIRDPDLDDPTCFARIEALVCLFEQYGLDAGSRHDFG